MLLTSSTQALKLKLAGSPNTTDPEVYAAWETYSSDGTTLQGMDSLTDTLPDATAISLVAGAANVLRKVKKFVVHNLDDTAIALTVDITDSGSDPDAQLGVFTLAAGDVLVYEDGKGYQVLTSTGQGKTDTTPTVSSLTGAHAAVLADVATTPGIVLCHSVAVAGGADANTDVALDYKFRFSHAKVTLQAAGTAGSLITVQNGATAITDAIDISAGADKAVFNNAEVDDAQRDIAAAGTLRVANASTGADCPACLVEVFGYRVA